MSNTRTATIQRKTAETDVQLTLNLDGSGASQIETGVGFFDHMLTLLAKHALFDLTIAAQGDLHVDSHHTVEDVGICLGKALAEALGTKQGIVRYGSKTLPMEETLVTSALDLSGRAWFVWRGVFAPQQGGRLGSAAGGTWWPAVDAREPV